MTKSSPSTSLFRPSSDAPAQVRLALLLCLLLAGASTATAQRAGSPVLVIDQERLFSESAFGQRIQAEIERRSESLAAENSEIEADLIAEEQRLTELRDETEPEAFQKMAAAFDDKVRRLRRDQDAKARKLARFDETARQRFLSLAAGPLSQLLRDRGAVALFDRRALILSLEAIDVTDAAIARIDAAIGDGSETGDAAPPDGGDAPPAATIAD